MIHLLNSETLSTISHLYSNLRYLTHRYSLSSPLPPFLILNGIDFSNLSKDLKYPFRYDLNQIPYDYMVEVTNRFKGLDLVEYLKNNRQRFMILCRKQ